MEKILLPVDGSASCNKSLKKVNDFATWTEVEVTVITVIEEDPSLSGIESKSRVENTFVKKDKLKEQAMEIAIACSKTLEDKVKILNKVVRIGNPATIICQEASDGDYDMVVISDMGKNAVKKFFLGSTTEKVVRHCSITTVVVK
ncbi:MAG: universal stress protein [bacterium]